MTARVIVVGGGPSGLTVATELARAGVDVVVLERRTQPVQSRAGTVLPRVLELLDSRGLAQKFIDRAATIRSNPLIPVHIWAGMQPVEWRHLESRFGFRLVLPQNHTEELLLEEALRLGVVVRHGVTVESVVQQSTAVTVTATAEDGPVSLSADYLVGADGGRSIVRSQLGLDFEGHGPTFTGIVADLRMDRPWPEARRMIDNDKGWVTSFPFGENESITRFNIVHAERRHAPAAEPVTADEVRRCLTDVLEKDLPFDDLVWASRFTDSLRIATKFQRGRVFLVGESARIHYPASGVGMNFCIQDAFNLGWKLAAVINEHAGPALLETYEAERRPVAEALLRSVAAQCSVQFDFTPEGVEFKRMFERDLLPIPEVNRRIGLELNGLSFPYPAESHHHPMVGYRCPDLDLVTAIGPIRMGEMLRDSALVLIDATGADTYADLALQGAPVRAHTGHIVLAPTGLGEVTSLLVRPDGYIAWASADAPAREDAQLAIKRCLAVD
ncbi:FAD-dependent oxidoreductase [Rhodococcus sp. IEGM 1305]|uniref:FAD-dependent oxidoreductase n=1 Tax=Rhodococcus sp. IEGM 1305 TaxID=3047092 RepID=UPI0024B7BAC6|nr:FAD-dependent oxidoreductase [Rhodococcus sp. IEGM 1305]MDI9953947.1 FAD-dependent oxidoreductase [Rhodococcus sp. IEGM 1305]